MIGAGVLAAPAAAQEVAGETQFNRQCAACHVVRDDDGEVLAGRTARVGPNLYDIPGAPPGSRHDFDYSDALVAYGESGAVWTEDDFVAFVQNPNGHLREVLDNPRARSKMAFQLRNEEAARDIYAFLVALSPGTVEGEAPGAAAGETVEDAASDQPPEGAASGASDQDIAAGEDIYQDTCRNCHGPTARGMASFPRLAGQDHDYLVTRLEQYKAGEEVGPNSGLMIPIASAMSAEDIMNVSAYIATTFE